MKLSLVISLFFVFFIGIFGYAQTYNYTYSDPCTGNLQTIVVPINGEITVGYYGFTETFSYNDFTGGGFETWASGIFAQYNGNSPCSEIVGIGTTVDVTQSTALNVIGILNSLTTIADLAGTTNILGGSIGSISNSPGGENNNDNENKNNGNSNVNNNSNNSSGTGSNVSNSSNQNQSTQQGSGQGGTETGGSQTSGSTEESRIPVLPYPLEKEAEEKHQQHLEVKEMVQKAMEHHSKVLKAKKQPQTEVWVAETKETKPKKTRKPRQKKTKGKQI